MAFQNIDNSLKYIAAKGNYIDIMNTMALICTYTKVYSTGQSPVIRKIQGGKETFAIVDLESMFTGATADVNSLHEYNTARMNFYAYVAATQPTIYAAIDTALYSRLCIVVTPGFPENVNDCQGNLLGSAANLAAYLTLWNDSKVDADLALCGIRTPYLFDTGVAGFLIESAIQPDNSKISYNTPGSTNSNQMKSFSKNRKFIVKKESQIQPKSISTFTSNI